MDKSISISESFDALSARAASHNRIWIQEIVSSIEVKLSDEEMDALVERGRRYGFKQIHHIVDVGTNLQLENMLKEGRHWVDDPDRIERTALHYACLGGKLEMVQILLRSSANCAARDRDGRTPLHFACSRGNIEVVKEMLGVGANLSAEDLEGLSSLHITVAYKQNSLLKYLLDQSLVPMNIEQTTQKTGLRPLHVAIESNNLEAIELLLQYGVNIEAPTSQGKSPLHLAIEKDNVEAVVTLLEKGADPLKPFNGKKPMEMALEAQKQHVVTALRQSDQRKLYPGHQTLKNSNSPRPERNDKPAAVKNLVLQGGSVKSIAYVGALKALEKHGVSFVKDLVRVGGTSAGSIFAMLIGLGYTWEELLQTLKELNFESLLDGKLKNKLLKMKDKKQSNMRVFINILNGTFGEIFKELQSKYGIFEGDHLYKFLLAKIEAKVKLYSDIPASEITFADLQAIRNKHPKSYFKDIFVIGTNLSLRRTEIFSPLHTPNMILADAVRISASIPFVFVPHRKYIKKDGKRVPDPAGHLYVDGGVLDNYPIWLFDQARYLDPYRTDSTAAAINHETLGLRLVSGSKKTNYEKLLGRGQQVVSDDKSDKDVSVDSLMKFIVNFAGCYNKQQENSHLINNHDMSRTVYIYHMDVSLISFNLGDAQKTALMLSGEVATDDYMRNRTAKKKMHVRLSRLALLHDEISITASDNVLEEISLELSRLKNISPVNLYKYFIGATPDEIQFLRTIPLWNSRDSDGNTALHLAVLASDYSTTDLMLQSQIFKQPAVQNNFNQTILDCAMKVNEPARSDLVRLVINAGVVYCLTENQATVRQLLVESGSMAATQLQRFNYFNEIENGVSHSSSK